MSLGAQFLGFAIPVSLGFLVLAFLLITLRIIKGPTLPDRILALDMLVAVGIGFIAVIGVKTGYFLYIDIAIALGLISFLATIAFARYVRNRGTLGDMAPDPEGQNNLIVHETKKTAKDDTHE